MPSKTPFQHLQGSIIVHQKNDGEIQFHAKNCLFLFSFGADAIKDLQSDFVPNYLSMDYFHLHNTIILFRFQIEIIYELKNDIVIL
jgi:hypothetical protein